jgi:hypothetical protein
LSLTLSHNCHYFISADDNPPQLKSCRPADSCSLFVAEKRGFRDRRKPDDFRRLATRAAWPHISDMIRIAIRQAAFDAIASAIALGMILFAAPAYAGSRFGGGVHGGRFPAFHRSGGRVLGFLGGYLCGFNCSFGFYNPGYGYFNGYGDGSGNGYFNGYGYFNGNGYLNGYSYGNGNGYFNGYGYGSGYGYGNGAGTAVSISNGLTGGYVPGPVGADIPPLIIPKNCWVRRAAYDPSGAYFGQVLVNLCRPSDSVTVTGLKARSQTSGVGTSQSRTDQEKP